MDYTKPTAQMLGRFQPWHNGHRALFMAALDDVGQVLIMVRNCNPYDPENNPYSFEEVCQAIYSDIGNFSDKFDIMLVPNITQISYGREVGYTIKKHSFSEDIENISGTKIRNDH